MLGLREPLKNSGSHIDASHSRQPLVKGERLVRYKVNAVMKVKGCNRFMQRWSGLQSCFPEPSNALCKSPDLSLPLILSPFNKAVKGLCVTVIACLCPCHCFSETLVPLAISASLVARLLPLRVCCSWLCAMPVQRARVPEQAQENSSP